MAFGRESKGLEKQKILLLVFLFDFWFFADLLIFHILLLIASFARVLAVGAPAVPGALFPH